MCWTLITPVHLHVVLPGRSCSPSLGTHSSVLPFHWAPSFVDSSWSLISLGSKAICNIIIITHHTLVSSRTITLFLFCHFFLLFFPTLTGHLPIYFVASQVLPRCRFWLSHHGHPSSEPTFDASLPKMFYNTSNIRFKTTYCMKIYSLSTA